MPLTWVSGIRHRLVVAGCHAPAARAAIFVTVTPDLTMVTPGSDGPVMDVVTVPRRA